MKKIVMTVAVAAFVALGLTSCKKDYTCKCTATGGGSSYTSSTTLTNVTKADAQKACDNASSGGGTSVTCELQ